MNHWLSETRKRFSQREREKWRANFHLFLHNHSSVLFEEASPFLIFQYFKVEPLDYQDMAELLSFVIIGLIIGIFLFAARCLVNFCSSLCGSEVPQDDRLQSVVIERPKANYEVAGRGTHYENGTFREYSIIDCKPYPLNVKCRYIECHSKNEAYSQAVKLSLGRRPWYHDAHKIGEKDHYHVHRHLLIKFDDRPHILYNYHFTFGPNRPIWYFTPIYVNILIECEYKE